MAEELVMPRLSDTMDTGTIAKWLKQEGDSIKQGDIIAEIETDKANMELEAFSAGILAQISVREGQSAAVGEPIAVLAANEEEAQSLRSSGAGSSNGKAATESATAGQSPGQAAATTSANEPVQGAQGEAATEAPSTTPQAGRTEPGGRIKASPLARRLAEEHGINLVEISGTGPGGRITKEDVQSYVKQAGTAAPAAQPAAAQSAQPAAEPAPQPQPAPAAQPAAAGSLRAPQPVEMTRMQQTIARRMAENRFTAPEFVLTASFDMTEARALLQGFRAVEGAPKIGPNDLLVKAVATALSQHPDINAGWENGGIVRYGRVNVGVAVAIPGGLVVPVVQDADKKSLGTISRESKSLIEKARNNKLAPSEYEGGTFTISNLGMYGIEQFTPIINSPEACIMGVGSIVPTPVVADGQIVVRELMHVTIACDHRVVNGALGAEFLQTLRRLLENPMLAVL